MRDHSLATADPFDVAKDQISAVEFNQHWQLAMTAALLAATSSARSL